MGGRGTYAAENNVAYTYETIGKIAGVKVLSGLNGKHGLPEEAHSSRAYIKLSEMVLSTKSVFTIKTTT